MLSTRDVSNYLHVNKRNTDVTINSRIFLLRTVIAMKHQPDVAVNQDTLQTDEVVRSRIVYEEIDSRVPSVRARSDKADYSGLESSTREVRPVPAVCG